MCPPGGLDGNGSGAAVHFLLHTNHAITPRHVPYASPQQPLPPQLPLASTGIGMLLPPQHQQGPACVGVCVSKQGVGPCLHTKLGRTSCTFQCRESLVTAVWLLLARPLTAACLHAACSVVYPVHLRAVGGPQVARPAWLQLPNDGARAPVQKQNSQGSRKHGNPNKQFRQQTQTHAISRQDINWLGSAWDAWLEHQEPRLVGLLQRCGSRHEAHSDRRHGDRRLAFAM